MRVIRSQVTLFLILSIAIIIVGLIFVSVITRSEKKPFQNEVTAQFSDNDRQILSTFIQESIKELALKGIFELGMQGGYNTLPACSFEKSPYKVPYYFHNPSVNVPALTILEKELSDYIQENLREAVDTTPLIDRGLEVEIDEATADVKILPESVLITVEVPVVATDKKTVIRLSGFHGEINVRQGHVMGVAGRLVDSIAKHPDRYDYTLFLNQDVLVTVIPLNTTHDIYMIQDKESVQYNGKDYTLLFASQR